MNPAKILSAVLIFISTACYAHNEITYSDKINTDSLPPVETKSPNSNYKPAFVPEWKNNLFVSALSGQHLDRLIIKNNKIVGEERLLADKNQRIRDVTYMNNKLYAITDDGVIYRISRN